MSISTEQNNVNKLAALEVLLAASQKNPKYPITWSTSHQLTLSTSASAISISAEELTEEIFSIVQSNLHDPLFQRASLRLFTFDAYLGLLAQRCGIGTPALEKIQGLYKHSMSSALLFMQSNTDLKRLLEDPLLCPCFQQGVALLTHRLGILYCIKRSFYLQVLEEFRQHEELIVKDKEGLLLLLRRQSIQELFTPAFVQEHFPFTPSQKERASFDHLLTLFCKEVATGLTKEKVQAYIKVIEEHKEKGFLEEEKGVSLYFHLLIYWSGELSKHWDAPLFVSWKTLAASAQQKAPLLYPLCVEMEQLEKQGKGKDISSLHRLIEEYNGFFPSLFATVVESSVSLINALCSSSFIELCLQHLGLEKNKDLLKMLQKKAFQPLPPLPNQVLPQTHTTSLPEPFLPIFLLETLCNHAHLSKYLLVQSTSSGALLLISSLSPSLEGTQPLSGSTLARILYRSLFWTVKQECCLLECSPSLSALKNNLGTLATRYTFSPEEEEHLCQLYKAQEPVYAVMTAIKANSLLPTLHRLYELCCYKALVAFHLYPSILYQEAKVQFLKKCAIEGLQDIPEGTEAFFALLWEKYPKEWKKAPTLCQDLIRSLYNACRNGPLSKETAVAILKEILRTNDILVDGRNAFIEQIYTLVRFLYLKTHYESQLEKGKLFANYPFSLFQKEVEAERQSCVQITTSDALRTLYKERCLAFKNLENMFKKDREAIATITGNLPLEEILPFAWNVLPKVKKECMGEAMLLLSCEDALPSFTRFEVPHFDSRKKLEKEVESEEMAPPLLEKVEEIEEKEEEEPHYAPWELQKMIEANRARASQQQHRPWHLTKAAATPPKALPKAEGSSVALPKPLAIVEGEEYKKWLTNFSEEEQEKIQKEVRDYALSRQGEVKKTHGNDYPFQLSIRDTSLAKGGVRVYFRCENGNMHILYGMSKIKQGRVL